MTTCRRASAPAAAASAAGVASDSAQGHDTTSTANVTASARDGSTCHQTTAVSAASTSSAPTNHAGDAIGDARDARPLARRALGEALDRREPRRLAGRADAHHERAVAHDAAREHRVARRLARAAATSPVRIASSTLRAAVDDVAVGRRPFAPGRTSTCSPGGERRRADALDVVARPATPARRSAVAGRARATRLDRVAGAPARDELDVARARAAAR